MVGDLTEAVLAYSEVKDGKIVFEIDPQKKAPKKEKPVKKETVE